MSTDDEDEADEAGEDDGETSRFKAWRSRRVTCCCRLFARAHP